MIVQNKGEAKVRTSVREGQRVVRQGVMGWEERSMAKVAEERSSIRKSDRFGD